jgi:hypothetical protein
MDAKRIAGMELGVPPLLQVFVQIKFLFIKQRVISCLIRGLGRRSYMSQTPHAAGNRNRARPVPACRRRYSQLGFG